MIPRPTAFPNDGPRARATIPASRPAIWAERAASLVEYALLIALIALALLTAVSFLGDSTSGSLDRSSSSLFG